MDQDNLNEFAKLLAQKEQDFLDKQEELDAQRGMLSTAIDELVKNNQSLSDALEALKNRNAELEHLLYQSSHGLRSPLSSILGIIKLMHYEPIPDMGKTYLHHIESKANHMVEIMNSLSTLSKLITEEINIVPVHIDELVQKNIDYFSTLAKANHVEITYRSEVSDSMINTDAFLFNAMVKQIFMNALIFRKIYKRGRVSISTSVEDNKLITRIADDGDGIDPIINTRIFEMFFRGSEKSGGSGLGLHIAKKAADLLRGSITFDSNSAGTTFEIIIPLS